MAIIKLSAIERRRLSVFFTCLVLAGMAWIFIVMSNSYNYTVKEVLNFKNAPQKRSFHPLQSDTVNITIQGTGWQMLFSKMEIENKPIDVDLRSLDIKNYIVLSAQLKQINSKKILPSEIVSISPDTLYFDFSNRSVKIVPVKLLTEIKYQHQFAQSNDVLIRPFYVTVSGPSNIINQINSWNTDTLERDSVDETVKVQLNLKPPHEANISIYPKVVNVVLPVDEFTEKTIFLPVQLINNHNYNNVKVFPSKVKVTFTTSLRKYDEVDEDFFEASADLDLWRDHGYTTLPVKLTRYPKYCKIVKIEPQNIDFIVKK